MEIITDIAKIKYAGFGLGGIDSNMIGLFMEFETEIWEASWNKTTLALGRSSFIPKEELNKELLDIVAFIAEILRTAKVKTLDQLKGKPVAVKFIGRSIENWDFVKPLTSLEI
jgi:hypothetical protein